MMIAAYLRVSSASQTAAMQRDAIERAAQARGDVVASWYADTFTGGTMARVELAKLRLAARAGDVRRLYVYRLDRLTRSGIRDTLDLVDEFKRHGCELVTVADGFEVGGPAAEIVLAVLAWAAKMERLAIGERISAARVRVEAKGGAWGRPRRMDPETERKARELRAAGHTLNYISQACKVPRATVGRVLNGSQKPVQKWGPRALAKNKLRRLKKQGIAVDLRKTRGH
jgi:DNA invertase Pin-like site-specific DNA recombinase